MIDVFLVHVAPIAAIGFIGWGLARTGTFSRCDAQSINKYVFYIALPVLMFSLLAKAPQKEFNLWLTGGYLISEIFLYAIGFAIAYFGFGRPQMEALLIGMSFAFVNHVFFVLPVAVSGYGSSAIAPIMSIVTVDSIALYAGTVFLLDVMSSKKVAIHMSIIGTLRNPNVLGILLGLAVNLSNMTLPQGVFKFTDFVSSSASPIALFSLGTILGQRRKIIGYALPVIISGFKVIIHPGVVWLLFAIGLSWNDVDFNLALLVAAGPCGAIPFVLALHYKVDEERIAYAILISSAASLASLSLLIQPPTGGTS